MLRTWASRAAVLGMLLLQRGGGALVLRRASAGRTLASRWRTPCSCGGVPRPTTTTVATLTTMATAATGADSGLAAAMRAALDQDGTDGLAAALRSPPPALAESMAGLSAKGWVETLEESSTLGVKGVKEKGRQVGTLASMMNTLLSTLSDDRADGTLLSKHDRKRCGENNAKLLADSRSAAGGRLDDGTILSNAVYNRVEHSLRRGTRKGIVQRGGVGKEAVATREGALDPKTHEVSPGALVAAPPAHTPLLSPLQALFKQLAGGVLSEVNGVLKVGKEASVYHAMCDKAVVDDIAARTLGAGGAGDSGSGSDGHGGAAPLAGGPRADVALKVFRTTLNEFSNRADYVVGDPRYVKRTLLLLPLVLVLLLLLLAAPLLAN